MPKTQAIDVRERLRKDFDDNYPAVQEFFDSVRDATKGIDATCTKCNRRSRVDVPDWNARTNALRLLLEAGYGRPRAESAEESSTTIIVERVWPIQPDELAAAVANERVVPPLGLAWPPGEHEEDHQTVITRDTVERAKALLIEAGWTPPTLTPAA